MNVSREPRTAISFVLFALWPTQYSVADTVYKTVDDQGHVSYSATPTDQHSSEKIKLLPSPSASDIEAAKKRLITQQETGEILEQARQSREQKRAEQNRMNQEQVRVKDPPPEEPERQGPYYGIPGHGIIVLPKGPTINP